jgi:hypothetical protein
MLKVLLVFAALLAAMGCDTEPYSRDELPRDTIRLRLVAPDARCGNQSVRINNADNMTVAEGSTGDAQKQGSGYVAEFPDTLTKSKRYTIYIGENPGLEVERYQLDAWGWEVELVRK